MSYPKELLATRSVVRPGLYAVIPPDGLVNNVLPCLTGCRTSIVCSPKMGASFVEYEVTVAPCGGTCAPFAGEDGVESFLYVVSGSVRAETAGESVVLAAGGYLFVPDGTGGLRFTNMGEEEAFVLLYKQRYVPNGKDRPHAVKGNVNEIPFRIYDEMENVRIKDLLPTDLAFDLNMHILSFEPGGCHPIVETHVQEHGAYILSGAGMYLLDERWMGIKKGDFMWFGPYVAQCAYGVGREPFAYIYSKDCNRDVII
ncbi:MAG: (S)-ureidoglycine aminohydrolase [Intestinimonas sp.]|jgi:(S)-ureidoglycine aminohydrolase|nr:(S)-ureidoglycine aminohydrolase [Intestinimonas sp.]